MTKGRILWVDDEVDLLRPHTLLLIREGYHVDAVMNGADAIELIEREQWVGKAAERGDAFADVLRSEGLPGVSEVRQAGMMLGLQLEAPMRALALARRLLERGYLVLPAGAQANGELDADRDVGRLLGHVDRL